MGTHISGNVEETCITVTRQDFTPFTTAVDTIFGEEMTPLRRTAIQNGFRILLDVFNSTNRDTVDIVLETNGDVRLGSDSIFLSHTVPFNLPAEYELFYIEKRKSIEDHLEKGHAVILYKCENSVAGYVVGDYNDSICWIDDGNLQRLGGDPLEYYVLTHPLVPSFGVPTLLLSGGASSSASTQGVDDDSGDSRERIQTNCISSWFNPKTSRTYVKLPLVGPTGIDMSVDFILDTGSTVNWMNEESASMIEAFRQGETPSIHPKVHIGLGFLNFAFCNDEKSVAYGKNILGVPFLERGVLYLDVRRRLVSVRLCHNPKVPKDSIQDPCI